MKIHFFTCRTGGGHLSGALAMREILGRPGQGWTFEVVQFYELIGSAFIDDLYNLFQRKGIGILWTAIMVPLFRFLGCVFFLEKGSIARLARYLDEQVENGDLLLVNLPVAPEMLLKALRKIGRQQKVYVLVIDFDEIPHPLIKWGTTGHPWTRNLVYLLPNEECRQSFQKRYGHTEASYHLMDGFPLRNDFYLTPENMTDRQRYQVTVVFGASGATTLLEIHDDLASRSRPDVDYVFVCGNDQKTYEKLLQRKGPDNFKILGYAENLPAILRQSDVVIGKPGSTTVMECLTLGVYYVAVRDINTMTQEFASIDYIKGAGVGTSVRRKAGVFAPILDRILNPEDPLSLERTRAKRQELAHYYQNCANSISRFFSDVIS